MSRPFAPLLARLAAHMVATPLQATCWYCTLITIHTPSGPRAARDGKGRIWIRPPHAQAQQARISYQGKLISIPLALYRDQINPDAAFISPATHLPPCPKFLFSGHPGRLIRLSCVNPHHHMVSTPKIKLPRFISEPVPEVPPPFLAEAIADYCSHNFHGTLAAFNEMYRDHGEYSEADISAAIKFLVDDDQLSPRWRQELCP